MTEIKITNASLLRLRGVNMKLTNNTKLSDNAKLAGNIKLPDNAKLADNMKLPDDTTLAGNRKLSKNKNLTKNLELKNGKKRSTMLSFPVRCARSFLGILLCVCLSVAMMPALSVLAYECGYYDEFKEGQTKWCDLNANWAVDYYYFTPTVSSYYTIYSYGRSGDPYVYVSTANNAPYLRNALTSMGKQNSNAASYSLVYNDDGGGDSNFSVNRYFEAGTTYYIFLTKYSTTRTKYNTAIVQNTYSIAYNGNGATSGSMSGTTMTYGKDGTLRSNQFVRSGYKFLGWSADSSATAPTYSNGQRFTQTLSKVNGATVTLYAVWEKTEYTVTLDNQGGTGGTQSVSAAPNAPVMPGIVPPTAPAGKTFQGYYAGTKGTGSKYYNADGTSAHKFDFSGAATIYAYYTDTGYELKLNNQGGTGGNSVTVYQNHLLPETLSVPSRKGYVFKGYYSGSGGDGTQYYDASGSRQVDTPYDGTATPKLSAVYAYWERQNVTVTFDLGGGSYNDAVTFGGSQRGDYSFVLGVPEYTAHLFDQWDVSGQATYNPDTGIVSIDSTLDGSGVLITADWFVPETLVYVDDSKANSKADADSNYNTEALAANYEPGNYSYDPEKGVTADEANSSTILELIVNQLQADGEGSYGTHDTAVSRLLENAQGTPSESAIFDVYVQKTVGATTTRLKEVAKPVEVVIPLTGNELEGKSSYNIWHYHDGTAEEIMPGSEDANYGQWFEKGKDGSGNPVLKVYLHTFSEIVVAYGNQSFSGITDGDGIAYDDGNDKIGVDVQGKVLESDSAPTYKLDISWGAMTFEYSKGAEWDPDSHTYTSVAINNWLPLGMDGDNNLITVFNHSNADMKLTFDITPQTGTVDKNASQTLDLNDALEGVSMNVKMDNDDYADEALNVPLSKVAYNGDSTAPSLDVYVRLNGSPKDVAGLAAASEYAATTLGKSYLKIAVVTLTVVPNSSTGLTPASGST
jgi:hypothetical protein